MHRYERKRIVVGITGITMLALLLAGSAGGATITVDDSNGADYTRIQDAVNAANNGDTIMVAAGMYSENVVVNKAVSLIGAGAEVTIVNAANPGDSVFRVTVNSVNISGFTVTGATVPGKAGIYLAGVNYTNISNNKASNNGDGIYLYNSNSNTLTNNTANSNNYYGFFLVSSSSNTLTKNTVNWNSGGLYVDSASRGVIITYNEINYSTPIYVDGSATISDNIISGGSFSGIFVDSGGSAAIYRNRISNISITSAPVFIGGGITIRKGATAHIEGNSIAGNSVLSDPCCAWTGGGIFSSGASTIIGNIISDNFASSQASGVASGINIAETSDNIISNNIITRNSGSFAVMYRGATNISIVRNTISNNPGGGVIPHFGSEGTVSYNTITENTIGIFPYLGGCCGLKSLTVSNNLISNNDIGIRMYGTNAWATVNISANHIKDNKIGGIFLTMGDITCNRIINNGYSASGSGGYGVFLEGPPPTSFTGNTLLGNSPYDLFNAQGGAVVAENNWWGTINTTQIDEHIYDFFDDTTKGIVTYTPFLSGTDSCAPSDRMTLTASITSPSQQTFTFSSPIDFASHVTGGTPPYSYSWESSRDGIINTAPAFSTSNLSIGTHTITLTVTDADGSTAADTKVITVTGVDLGIKSSDISFSNPRPMQNEEITINASITNSGTDSASDVSVRFYDDAALIGEDIVPTISAQSSSVAEIRYVPEISGYRFIKVVVDEANSIREGDETNNIAVRPVAVGTGNFYGGIDIISASIDSPKYTGEYTKVNGNAIYNTTFGSGESVAGALVTITIDGKSYPTYTTSSGTFSADIISPFTAGQYPVVVRITDYTFVKEANLLLTVNDWPVQLPDLVITEGGITFPQSYVVNESSTINANIFNIGKADASDVTVHFYDDGVLFDNMTIPSISEGGSAPVSGRFTPSYSGTHTISVKVDVNDTIEETNENNNQASRNVYVYPDMPDFTPLYISYSDSTPYDGQNVNVSADIANIGGKDGTTDVSFYLDNNFVGRVPVSVPGRNGHATAQLSVTFVYPEWHQIKIIADEAGIVKESNENNNETTSSIYVHPRQPDLTAVDISVNISNPILGDSILVTGVFRNDGETPANDVTAVLYIGSQSVNSTNIPALAPDSSETITYVWTPAADGYFDINLSIDPQNTIEESNENNNIRVETYYIRPQPDLTVEEITFNNSSPKHGDAVNITAAIKNIGKTSVSNVKVAFYDGGSIIGETTIPEVSNLESTSIEWNAIYGLHTIKAVVDPYSEIREISEANNERIKSIDVLVPDIQILSEDIYFSNDNPDVDENITIYANISNVGTYTAENIDVKYYIDDILINITTIDLIDIQSSKMVETDWSAESAGSHVVKIDASFDAFEPNKTNNIATRGLIVKILNRPPVADAGGPYYVNEGSSVTVNASGSYDPDEDVLTYVWDLDNDSIYETDGMTAVITPPDGPTNLTIGLQVSDGKGGIDNDTANVTVNNTAPDVNAGPDAAIDEGSDFLSSGSFTDSGSDIWTGTVDYGDGSPVEPLRLNPDKTFSLNHTYTDNGKYNVTVTITDDDAGSGSDTANVTVNNTAPNVNAGPDAAIDEGSDFLSSGSFTDPGSDIWTGTVDYGDGSPVEPLRLNPDKTFSLNHTYTDNGNYSVSVTITDDDAGSGSDTANVTVNNIAPDVSGDPHTQSVQYSDPIFNVTISAKDMAMDMPFTASTSWKKDGDVSFSPGLPTELSLVSEGCDPGICTWRLTGNTTVEPGKYIVRITVTDDEEASNHTDIELSVTREDALATYTGAIFASTYSITDSRASVTLSATIQDISVIPGDNYPGDIQNAIVTFVDRDKKTPLCTAPVGLVNPTDPKVGTATCEWNVDIGNAESVPYTVGIVVGSYYIRDASADNTVVTVSKPLMDNFITGGGYLVLSNSAGQKAGDAGTKNNFGFNVKYNKGGTNLQGRINIIIRRTESDGKLHVYQIKGNSMTSLSVDASQGRATFNGKASIQDITDLLTPISIDGGAALQVSMIDRGEPGSNDTIAITVWNKKGGLWFASSWDGTKTTERTLDGGNLMVH